MLSILVVAFQFLLSIIHQWSDTTAQTPARGHPKKAEKWLFFEFFVGFFFFWGGGSMKAW